MKRISKKTSRKLTERLYQTRLIVFEWTPEMQALYNYGQALEELLRPARVALERFGEQMAAWWLPSLDAVNQFVDAYAAEAQRDRPDDDEGREEK